MVNKIKITDKHVISITNGEMKKIFDTINLLKNKIKKSYQKIIDGELLSTKKYNFELEKSLVISHQKLVTYVIKKVINSYKTELKELETVFLACSFGRGTNKITSDLDLHFIYTNNNYDYRYEEIACYIISSVLGKRRDDIDPKMITNFDKNLKSKYENIMTKKDLKIIIKSPKYSIEYFYKYNKKKKFYLQYNVSKTNTDFKKYIYENGIQKNNLPWAHSYLVIIGKEKFKELVVDLIDKELKLLDENYFELQKGNLRNDLNSIDFSNNINIKKLYQTKIFTNFYKYLNVLRLYYLKKGYRISNLNIYTLYDIIEEKEIISLILEYLWEIKKLSVYCLSNNISYSLHEEKLNNDVSYNFNLLEKKYNEIREKMLINLKEIGVKNDE